MKRIERRISGLMSAVVVVAAMALSSTPSAHAADKPDRMAANQTIFYSAVGGAFGGMVGAGVGGGLALYACRNQPECYLLVLTVPFFGGIGAISGLAIGASNGAKRSGRMRGPAVWTAGLVGLGGLATVFIGAVSFRTPVVITGGAMLFVGAPLAAGWAASRSRLEDGSSVAPMLRVGPDRLLVGVQGRF
ncbi:MAG: hypothetical protein AB8H79_05955 [Myxococcota bacterium]